MEQGVALGCSLSPILFSMFINVLLKEVEEADVGIDLSSGGRLRGLLFADDFVGVSESTGQLQNLIVVVHESCNKWRLKAIVGKSAVMVFARKSVEGTWVWGEHADFTSTGASDVHNKDKLDSGQKKVNQLHNVISNRDMNLSAHRLLLMVVVRPTLENRSKVWQANRSQAAALELVMLGGAK